MRAARYERLGPAAEVLSVVDIDDPHPAPGEVRVRVHVSGVNPTDWKRRLLGPAVPPSPGQIPHQDGSGEIDEIGSKCAISALTKSLARMKPAGVSNPNCESPHREHACSDDPSNPPGSALVSVAAPRAERRRRMGNASGARSDAAARTSSC